MVLEIARFTVKAGHADDFADAVRGGRALLEAARGFRSLSIKRALEEQDVFYLLVRWETLEDHTVHFRRSPNFDEWRALLSPFLTSPPDITHTEPL